MSRRRKLTLAGIAALAVIMLICWLRQTGPTYEGKTVEKWFRSYDEMRNKGFYDLSVEIKPPGEMLLPLIKPALESANPEQRVTALIALRGISSGHELARPYLERGFKDPSSQVQRFAAVAIRWLGSDGKWAVSNLLELAHSPDFDTHADAVHALNTLGTNSWPVVPRLKKMLSAEQDEKRRQVLANAIDYISSSGPPGLQRK